jgi:hypothetical protein
LPSYVGTADAISKYFSDDFEWRRLSDQFHSIARDPGALGSKALGPGVLGPNKERQLEHEVRAEQAKRELAKRENYLLDNVYAAVVQQELQLLLMDGDRTFQLPGLYIYDSARMVDALRSGWAGKLRLTGPDTAWQAARLVFPEADWQRCREEQAQRPADDAASQSDDRAGLEKVRAVIRGIARDGNQLRRRDFDAMVRELVDRRILVAHLEALWRELSPREWRRPGQGSPSAGLMVAWKEYLGPR